jgi:hypothetical protein
MIGIIAALPSALLSTNTILEKLVAEEPEEAALSALDLVWKGVKKWLPQWELQAQRHIFHFGLLAMLQPLLGLDQRA